MPTTSDNRRNRSPRGPETDLSPCLFWLLLVTGLTVLGACIVTPSWVKFQILDQQQLELSKQLEQLRISSVHQAEAIEAAQLDVAFNERLLIEELNYHRPGEQALAAVSRVEPAAATSISNNTDHRNWGWLQAFTEPDSRRILLIMATGLVVFAFVYYRPKGRSISLPEIPVRPAPAKFIR